MIQELIEIEGKQVRFFVNHENERRKLFTIFNASGDISLAFHSYLKADRTGEINSNSTLSGQTFKISDAVIKEFEIHKFNFHKSGTGNVKNKINERSNDDFQSIAFDKIKDAANLMVYQPTYFEQYPAIRDQKKYYNLTQGNIKYIPPNVQFILSNKNFNLISEFEKHEDSIMFIHKTMLEPFGLDLCINVRQHVTKKFPKYAYVGSITY